MVLLTLMIAMGAQAITIIEGEELDKVETVESLGGVPPPVLNLTSSCPCDKLILSSLGPAATLQPKTMGIYTQ
jgi:hypothetical protein